MTEDKAEYIVKPQPSFAKKVWSTLSKIDVSEHTQTKVNFTYLSWAWAWETLMTHFPESAIEKVKEVQLADNTVECLVTITVRENGNELTRKMWLPVMDHKNKSIAMPDSRAISDTRMRCLTKCLGLFGLGLYIYQGESMPYAVATGAISDEDLNNLTKRLKDTKSNIEKFKETFGIDTFEEMTTGQFKQAMVLIEQKAKQVKK